MSAPIRDAVARYATRFHRLLAGRHSVASPLGAWLLLALVAPSAAGRAREELADVLGCGVDEAFASAAELLRDPHAEVVLGSAVWHDASVETPRLLDLLRRVAPPADSGPIPAQAAADAWAREHTLGLIERFPLALEPATVLLLATAIATKVSWEQPFVLAAADDALLPAHPAFEDLPLLRDPGRRAWQGFVDTDAGLVAGFSARSRDGLAVTSVVGDPGADPAAVLDAAQQIAIAVASGGRPPTRSLFDLPLGDGPAWRIGEQSVPSSGPRERYEALLPAWEASSDFGLTERPELGFGAAARALLDLLPPGEYAAGARQSALARYTRVGFEAAAVTGMMMTASAVLPREGPVRTARMEFNRPHAVVAVTEGVGGWDGLPVFAAWVEQAVPAE